MSKDRVLLIVLAVVFAGYVVYHEAKPSGRPDIVGVASVIDGDTIIIHGAHIRLMGIDAPESDQTCADAAGAKYRCGQKASFALSDMLGQATVTCHDSGERSYKRPLAHCFLGGRDIQAAMVRQGWAIAYRRYSHDYVAAEDEARMAKAGIWAGTFVEPERWRHDKSARN